MNLGLLGALIIALAASLAGLTIFRLSRRPVTLERLKRPLEAALSDMVTPLHATISDLSVSRVRWSGIEITVENIRLLSDDGHIWVSFAKTTMQKPLAALLSPTALIKMPVATPIEFSGAMVDAIKPQTPFDSLHGVAISDGKGLRFDIAGGEWEQAIISRGTVRLDGLGTPNACADISFQCDSRVNDALRVVTSPPLNLLDFSAVDPTRIDGVIKAEVHLNFGFDDVSLIEYQTRAEVSDLCFADGPAGLALTGGRFDMKVTNEVTVVDGTVQIAGIPLKIHFSKPSHASPETLKINTNNLGAIVGAMRISGRLVGGRTQVTLARQHTDGLWSGPIDLHDVRILQAPILARLLTMASLPGLVSRMTDDGLTVDNARSDITIEGGVIRCSSIRVSVDQLEITGNAVINIDNGLVEGEGLLVPAASLQRLVGAVPVVGAFLEGLGRKNSPVLATRFTLSGSLSRPEITVEPLMSLAPGILRELGLS